MIEIKQLKARKQVYGKARTVGSDVDEIWMWTQTYQEDSWIPRQRQKLDGYITFVLVEDIA